MHTQGLDKRIRKSLFLQETFTYSRSQTAPLKIPRDEILAVTLYSQRRCNVGFGAAFIEAAQAQAVRSIAHAINKLAGRQLANVGSRKQSRGDRGQRYREERCVFQCVRTRRRRSCCCSVLLSQRIKPISIVASSSESSPKPMTASRPAIASSTTRKYPRKIAPTP